MTIRMISIPISDEIHIDDLRQLINIVKIDMMGGWKLSPEPNDLGFIDQHWMFVDLSYFEGRRDWLINTLNYQYPKVFLYYKKLLY